MATAGTPNYEAISALVALTNVHGYALTPAVAVRGTQVSQYALAPEVGVMAFLEASQYQLVGLPGQMAFLRAAGYQLVSSMVVMVVPDGGGVFPPDTDPTIQISVPGVNPGDPPVFVSLPLGNIKVWDGNSWEVRPLKVWDGSVWRAVA